MSHNLKMKNVRLPKRSVFAEQITALLDWCERHKATHRQPSQRSKEALRTACATLIEGLYQCNSVVGKAASLELPLSPQYYHRTAHGKINHLSFYFISLALKGLIDLGWAKVNKGYQRFGTNEITRLRASGELLNVFATVGCQWLELAPRKELILLRDKDPVTKWKIALPVPNTKAVKKMRSNLKKYNAFIAKQAICLHMTNAQLKQVKSSRVANMNPALLNFNHTALYRVFSRGDMTKGGRFYGGWWQSLKNKDDDIYRSYLTINGLATGEIDYSELHPRFLYERFGATPPPGDQYDDGWRDPSVPYSKDVEPYETRRGLFKTVFNAILNNEGNRIELKEKRVEAKKCGLTIRGIKATLLKKHPLLKRVAKSGIGLEFQYLDSRIAEHVMMLLLEQGIPCLPVHDSFIVPRHQANELRKAMDDAFRAIIGKPSKLKPLEAYRSGFLLPFKPNGEVDNLEMYKMHSESLHNGFVQSWLNCQAGNAPPRQ